jgi:uncharacterized protein involved in exopolysaccharide biosynthesis
MLIVLARRKRVLVFLPLASMLIAAVASMFVPDVYRSNATLLPPQQAQSSAAALLSQLGGVGGLAAGVAGIKSPNDLYIGMLQSRTLTDTLINRFALKKEYETESLEKARKKLAENTAIATGKDGLITISVEGERKPMVAQLANGYVDELMKLTRTLAVTEASQRRLFFERQLESAKDAEGKPGHARCCECRCEQPSNRRDDRSSARSSVCERDRIERHGCLRDGEQSELPACCGAVEKSPCRAE